MLAKGRIDFENVHYRDGNHPGRSWAAAFRPVEKEIVWEGEGVDEVGRDA